MMQTTFRAISLERKRCACVNDVSAGIAKVILPTPNAVKRRMDCIYQIYPTAVVRESYKALNDIGNGRRGQYESIKNYQSQFSAQVVEFNSISSVMKLLE